MTDGLFEKFLQLLRDQSAQNGSLPRHPFHSWGGIKDVEENTLFLKESSGASKRVLSLDEQIKLTKKSAQFLSELLYIDIIGESTFELIMNQLFFSTSGFVALDETKWTIHQTLVDSLTPQQMAMLDLILYQFEEGVTRH